MPTMASALEADRRTKKLKPTPSRPVAKALDTRRSSGKSRRRPANVNASSPTLSKTALSRSKATGLETPLTPTRRPRNQEEQQQQSYWRTLATPSSRGRSDCHAASNLAVESSSDSGSQEIGGIDDLGRNLFDRLTRGTRSSPTMSSSLSPLFQRPGRLRAPSPNPFLDYSSGSSGSIPAEPAEISSSVRWTPCLLGAIPPLLLEPYSLLMSAALHFLKVILTNLESTETALLFASLFALEQLLRQSIDVFVECAQGIARHLGTDIVSGETEQELRELVADIFDGARKPAPTKSVSSKRQAESTARRQTLAKVRKESAQRERRLIEVICDCFELLEAMLRHFGELCEAIDETGVPTSTGGVNSH
ncbi:unnamed protein product [Jaminaea pallidilutea]